MMFLNRQATESGKPITDLEGALGDAAEKFHAMGPGPQAAAEAMKMFGRAGVELLPLLLQGKEGIASLTAEADKLGLTLTEKDVEAANQFQDSLDRLKGASAGLMQQIGVGLAPVLTTLTNAFLDNMSGGKNFARVITEVAARGVQIFSVMLADLTSGLGDFLGLFGGVSPTAKAISEGLNSVSAKFTQIDEQMNVIAEGLLPAITDEAKKTSAAFKGMIVPSAPGGAPPGAAPGAARPAVAIPIPGSLGGATVEENMAL